MIDEKGRLFGRVNIVDLLVVLVLIAGLSFYAGSRGGLQRAVPTVPMTITVESEPVHPGVATDIAPGDEVAIWNGSTTLVIGKVDKIEFLPYPNRATVDGRVVVADDPVQQMVRLTLTGPAARGRNIVTMNSQVVMLGTRFQLRSAQSNFLVAVREMHFPEGAR